MLRVQRDGDHNAEPLGQLQDHGSREAEAEVGGGRGRGRWNTLMGDVTCTTRSH
jgi:hypothetical protein